MISCPFCGKPMVKNVEGYYCLYCKSKVNRVVIIAAEDFIEFIGANMEIAEFLLPICNGVVQNANPTN